MRWTGEDDPGVETCEMRTAPTQVDVKGDTLLSQRL